MSENKQPQNIPGQTPQVKEMEVHHHPHVEKKKFKEYFLEFFMIFLAVTMGFFAENLREHFSDKEKERQLMESMVKCLATDTTRLESIIRANHGVIREFDSLSMLRQADLSNNENKRRFLEHSMIVFSEDWFFKTNDAAFEQLKSSGLRFIHKQNIIDSIFKYDQKNKATITQETDYYNIFRESYPRFKRVVDLSFLMDTSVVVIETHDDYINFRFKNIAAVSIDIDKDNVKDMFAQAAILAATEYLYVLILEDQLVYAKSLIEFLKNEYHFE